jgi:hypothetical protein
MMGMENHRLKFLPEMGLVLSVYPLIIQVSSCLIASGIESKKGRESE